MGYFICIVEKFISCYGIGLLVGALVMYVIMQFAYNRNIKSDPEPMGIGTLYIYEGADRDRYSFAFDCPLDQVGKLKTVTLDIQKRREKSLKEIESDLFAEDFDANIDNI